MESADDSDFSGSDEDINESKTVTVSIVVPSTTTSDEVIENGKEKSHDTTKSVQQVTPTGLKESPKQEKKRLRLKDDLAISPDQTKIGKRQRKVNSLYSGYAIDKKTTQFFSQNASPTITETAVNPVQANKREIIMSPAEAQKRQKNLPKGYAYEPIFVANQASNNNLPTSETPSSSSSTSSKRERKKKKENPEFVDPDEDSGEVSTTTSTIETPASKTRSKRSRGSASSTPISSNVEHIGDTSNQVQTITVHPIVERKLDEDEDVVVEEEEDDDYLSESEEEFEEGTKKKRGYYRTKKQTLQMQLQELQSKLDLVTQNLAAAQNAAGTQSQSSSTSSSGQKQNSKRRGSGTPAGRQKKKKEKDSFLDSDYEEDYDSEDSYSKKSRKKTSPSIRGNSSSTSGGGRGPGRRKKEDIGVDVNKELGQCKRIIQALMKNQSAFPFNQPVDPVALGIMDYFDIIKNPMDLKTILDSLNAGEYENADDVAADVRLVWRNAATYNGPNHTVTKMAQVLSQLFEKKFKKIRPYGPLNTSAINDYSTNTTTTSISSSSTSTSSIKQHMQSTISELRDSMIQMREEIQALRKEKAAAATAAKQMARQSAPAVPGIPKQRGPGRPKTKNKPTPIHKSVTREDARPMTFEEKRILSENINLLDAEALGKVVQLIHQRMPNLAQNGNDEIEIDIDAMDAATLRHLEKFVKNSLNKLRKKGGSAPPTKIQAAEIVSQNTSKSIQDVKQRLQELSTRSTALKKKKIEEEGNEDVVIDDVQEENKNYPSVLIEPDSSSSSDSSSDSDSSSSSSSSSSDSDSSGPDKKKKKKDKLSDLNNTDSSIPPPITVTIDKAPISEQKDNISLSPVRTETTTTNTTTTTTTTTTSPNESETSTVKKEEAPQILHPAAVSKEVELKNVDAWKFDLDAWDTQAVSSTTSPSSQTKDETWSQFQNRDLQNQLREKEREERERKEKEERELERKKQEEQRQREIAEAEENKKRAEQEENERKQKEIEARREAARKAREEMSAQRSVMDQSIMMQSFEMNHDTSDKPALLDVFKLKQDDLSSDRAPPREEGEV